jgi:hypothetical protein
MWAVKIDSAGSISLDSTFKERDWVSEWKTLPDIKLSREKWEMGSPLTFFLKK